MKPKISVIVPVYNTEKFLVDCIESLLAQTYENLELIFINDASTDNSGTILEGYKDKYPDKIKIVHLEVNMRQGGARNRGLEIATGEFIGFIDSDDYVLCDMYETLYHAIVKNDSDVSGILYASLPEEIRYADLDKYVSELKPIYEVKEEILAANGKELDCKTRSCVVANSFGGVVCKLWRKEFLEKTGILFPEKVAYEDNYWQNLVFSYVNKIEVVPQVKYIYRVNYASTTRKKFDHVDRLAMEEKLQCDAEKHGVLAPHKEAYEYIYTFRRTINTATALLSRCMPPKIKVAKELYSELKEKYPQWRENVYYLENYSEEERQRHLMILEHPLRYATLSMLWKLNAWRRNFVKNMSK